MIKIQQIEAATTWNLRHQVMWPNCPINYVKLPKDEEGIHFGLFVNDELQSVISLFVEGKNAQFRKFATHQSTQGKGYGTRLLKHLMKYAEEQEIDRIWCNARCDKTSFYKRFGMETTDQFFEKGGISYVIMEKGVKKDHPVPRMAL